MDSADSNAPSPKETPATGGSSDAYGEDMSWHPEVPRVRLLPFVLAWIIAGISVFVAAAIVPGVKVGNFGDAFVAAASSACSTGCCHRWSPRCGCHSRWRSASCSCSSSTR
jgi:hypothetical protein